MLPSTNSPLKRMLPIIKVVSAAMKFLKDRLIELLQDEDSQLKDSQVRWVVTVPAIWQAPARQLMREAAYMVSCILTNLSHYCSFNSSYAYTCSPIYTYM